MLGKSWVAGAVGLLVVLCGGQAQAATINVNPGPNAIQSAIDRADAGDKLLIKRGRYAGDIVVDKRLKIVGKNRKPPTIDGGCDTATTVDVTANGVTLRHLRIKGARSSPGDGYTVNLAGVGSGKLRDLVLKETCNANPAYYGVNVFQTGALEITGLRTSGGFIDAGIYVGSIGDVGSRPFLIAGNEAFDNNIGILIEDSVPEANILVRRNHTHDNDLAGLSTPAGILVRRSDGGRYIANRVNRNGRYGIHLLDDFGNSSDENVLRRNRARRNGERNFLDQGVGNCGSGNSFPISRC